MTGILVPLIVFLSITAWILGPRFLKMWHEQRLRELGARGGNEVQVKQLQAERSELEARLRNLESIVCSVDFELNAKLNKLASRPLYLPARSSPTPSDDPRLAETVPMAQATRLDPGRRIADRFVVERALGSGGMGAVYLARDEQLGEPVALKLIRDVQQAEPHVLDRFRREVSAARRISHPNVVRLHDLGEENGQLFISMEYVAGDSLRAVLTRTGALPPDRVRTLASQLCDGLEAAHAAGVIHRDLKPENVLFTASQQVKIIDFGIAKIADLEGMTATRVILGTPQYMAPEHIRGRTLDGRADLYALGVILFEALAGTPPYDGPSPIAISFAHCNDPVPSLRHRRPDVPEAWDVFVRQAMAKDPAERFDSAAAMRHALPS